MTPAEMKTIRESLGLSVPWMARIAGVQERTVRYWESGHTAVPGDVADTLTNLDCWFDHLSWQAVKLARETQPERVTLLRYKDDETLWQCREDFKNLPATCHGALVALVRRKLENDLELDCDVRIVYFEPDQYREWLGNHEDSEAMRAAWAAEEKL